MESAEIKGMIERFREAQPGYKESRQELENKRKQFLDDYPLESITSMSIDDYVQGKGLDSFCKRIERGLERLGSMRGGTAIKFGIYYSAEKNKYVYAKWTLAQAGLPADDDVSEEMRAFSSVKQCIAELLDAGKTHDWNKIGESNLGPTYRGKLLSTYYPENYPSIFKKTMLQKTLSCLGLPYSSKENELALQRKLIGWKEGHDELNDMDMQEFTDMLGCLYDLSDNTDETEIEREFTSWMKEQINADGVPFSGRTISGYKSALKAIPRDFPEAKEWKVFGSDSTEEAKQVYEIVKGSPLDKRKRKYQYSNGCSQYINFLEQREQLSGTDEDENAEDRRFWWCVANPDVWNPDELDSQDYDLYNEKGQKKAYFSNYESAKVGDPVILYQSTPLKRVWGLWRVEKEQDGEKLAIGKMKPFENPVAYEDIGARPELQDMEYLKNVQKCTFGKLTKAEYECILGMAEESIEEIEELLKAAAAAHGELEPEEEFIPYTRDDFLRDVFMEEAEYDRLVSLLEDRKNVILEGSPGTGKTFAAERLAWSMLGRKGDKEHIKMVQFHQNYSYEDFMMGYKPNEAGGFDLKPGVFYDFCEKARKNSWDKYFFLIDEINRGNLSKIFGELLMLIEGDKRDKSVRLAYKDEEYSVPENVFIIGMMNTADRSLAMIDYALRRRFAFVEMEPAFGKEVFEKDLEGEEKAKLKKLADKVVELNKVIEEDLSLGPGFKIGHSYFCFGGKREFNENRPYEIVHYDLIPTLREYWFDEKKKFEKWEKELKEAIGE